MCLAVIFESVVTGWHHHGDIRYNALRGSRSAPVFGRDGPRTSDGDRLPGPWRHTGHDDHDWRQRREGGRV